MVVRERAASALRCDDGSADRREFGVNGPGFKGREECRPKLSACHQVLPWCNVLLPPPLTTAFVSNFFSLLLLLFCLGGVHPAVCSQITSEGLGESGLKPALTVSRLYYPAPVPSFHVVQIQMGLWPPFILFLFVC